jgi:RNA polymerase sigma factor (sigma-70 family)
MMAQSTQSVNPAFVYQYQGEAVAAASERSRLLSAALAKLPERERLTVILRLEDWTLEAIAELLAVSRERVRQIETKALEMLRAIFGEMGVNSLAEIM